jgi:hypothetical protein
MTTEPFCRSVLVLTSRRPGAKLRQDAKADEHQACKARKLHTTFRACNGNRPRWFTRSCSERSCKNAPSTPLTRNWPSRWPGCKLRCKLRRLRLHAVSQEAPQHHIPRVLVCGVQFTLLLFQAANKLALVELDAGWVCEVRNPYSCATPGKPHSRIRCGIRVRSAQFI